MLTTLSCYHQLHTIAVISAKTLLGGPQRLLTKCRPYSALYEVSCDFRLAPNWQMKFLRLVSTASRIARTPSFETRRGRGEVKTRSKHLNTLPKNQTCLILKTISRRAQEASRRSCGLLNANAFNNIILMIIVFKLIKTNIKINTRVKFRCEIKNRNEITVIDNKCGRRVIATVLQF